MTSVNKYWRCMMWVLLAIMVGTAHAQSLPLIPYPQKVQLGNTKTTFSFSSATYIRNRTNDFDSVLNSFCEILSQWESLQLTNASISHNANKIEVVFEKQKDSAAYILLVRPSVVTIKAQSASGVGNALSTLLQLILSRNAVQGVYSLPICTIEDAPVYSWRGFMLDESRHFFGKGEVKKILDQMFLFKLNRFHWHLTDEPAWRMEIKRYPLLTTVGAKGNYTDTFASALYYTQNDIREIVQYASNRNIIVIPEIDMPGHATAANKAYPQYSGGGSVKHPDFTFNPGYDSTYSFLTNILKEVKTLFPSRIVHIGGDEVSFGNEKWRTDSMVTRLKKENNLLDDVAVEKYFIRRMADSVRKLGLVVLGWDEVTPYQLPTDSTIIMWWRHDKPEQLRYALESGYKVVLTPRLPFYFDFVQADRDKVGRRWNGFNQVKDVYRFSIDSLLAAHSYKKQILGMQANLWTETVKTKQRLEYLVFPRIVAMAANSWGINRLEKYASFEERLSTYLALWKKLGIQYFDVLHPANTPEITDTKKATAVEYLDK
ncbi:MULTISPECIES: beta-N-acetylhexosaminidase [Chitinophagaceae]